MDGRHITLGQEILRFRKDQGISQFDLAVRMDWNSTSPIIQIEKNRRVPKPETLERLGVCMNLNYLQTHYLLGMAGYVPPTILPRKQQVTRTLDHVAVHLSKIKYPSYIVDYQFRFWMFNPGSAILTFGDYCKIKHLLAARKGVFDMLFDSRLGFRQYVNDVKSVEIDQIFRFKATNSFRQHEEFFKLYPGCMEDSLLPQDYNSFIKAWNSIDMNTLTDAEYGSIPDFYDKADKGDLLLNYDEGPVYFNVVVQSILHLGDLFQIITYVPSDPACLPQNRRAAEEICRKYATKDVEPIKLWEVADIDRYF